MVVNYKKYTEVTEELIDTLDIHITYSSLRRDCSMAKWIGEEAGTDSIFKLYYVTYVDEPTECDWEVHACEDEITAFLLRQSAGDAPEPEPDPEFKKSLINWDPGKVGGADLTVTKADNDTRIIFSGEIAYYPEDEELNRPAGNQVGVTIEPGEGMLEKYPGVQVKIGNSIYGAEVFNEYQELGYQPMPAIYYYPLIKVAGQSNPVEITWDATHKEVFHIDITPESTLATSENPEVTEFEI